MELSKRDQSFELLMQGFAADYKVWLEDSLAKGGAMKRRRRFGQEAQRAADRRAREATEAMKGLLTIPG